MLDLHAWLTLAVIVVTVVALVREVARPDIILLGAVGLLLLGGVLEPEEAFAGFSNPAVLTVGALFVVAAGVQRTEALGMLNRVLFGARPRLSAVLPRLMLPTAFLSAFLNNTPIVAMLVPRVQAWSERSGVPPSKLLIPLSYAAILGGMVTLIGTSTNLVVAGLMQAGGYEPLHLFTLTWVGVPAVLVVALYFVLGGHRLLPSRGLSGGGFQDGLTDCLFDLKVSDRSPFIGLTVEEARLRNLGDAYLAHVHRGDHFMPAAPTVILQAGDVLTFVGNAQRLEALLERPGLQRAVRAVAAPDDRTLPLFEAVVADGSSLVGKTLKESGFRDHYGGVVLAIQRRDEQVRTSLGRVPIKAGDLLLVEASNGFDKRWNANRDEFYLVAARKEAETKPNRAKAPVALALLVGTVVLAATGLMPIVTAAFAAALGMIVTRCLRLSEARRAVDLQVLVVIAAALGLGQAVQATGLAATFAHLLLGLAAGGGILAVLAALYVTTNLLTEMITNNAAAVLMLPVALAAAADLGAAPEAFAVVVAVAASASFLTPIGYQTNLMVMSAGGYRFKDYFRVGLPVSLLVLGVTMLMVWLVWLG